MHHLQEERDRLRAENEKFIQHANNKQKIQYHVKIKKENNDLKAEIVRLMEVDRRISTLRLTKSHASNTDHRFTEDTIQTRRKSIGVGEGERCDDSRRRTWN